MITHIVMFAFKDENKEENLHTAKKMLDGLMGKVPSLLSMEVGLDFMHSERSFDLVLTSTFESKEALASYTTHPEHMKVVGFIKEVTTMSKVVDYEKL